MKKYRVSFDYVSYDSIDELTPEESSLLARANTAREKAYSPYSGFNVGAAVLMGTGKVVVGSNQENASYPSGLCAERVAVFSAGANYPNQVIKMIAITAGATGREVLKPAGPCGNCRQAILEYEQKQQRPIVILLQGSAGPIYKCQSVADLLPLAFNSSFLSDS